MVLKKGQVLIVDIPTQRYQTVIKSYIHAYQAMQLATRTSLGQALLTRHQSPTGNQDIISEPNIHGPQHALVAIELHRCAHQLSMRSVDASAAMALLVVAAAAAV
jgi:hypothetical protein